MNRVTVGDSIREHLSEAKLICEDSRIERLGTERPKEVDGRQAVPLRG